MGILDGMTASSYREEGGDYYLIGFGPPRRFRTEADYRRSRSRLEIVYGLGLGLLPVLAYVGRNHGYGWALVGAALAVVWLIIFGRRMISVNSEPAAVVDTASDHRERTRRATGVPTTLFLLIASAVLSAGGFLLAAAEPSSRLVGLAGGGLFGLAALVFAADLVRFRREANVRPAQSGPAVEPAAFERPAALSAADAIAIAEVPPLPMAIVQPRSAKLPWAIAGVLALTLAGYITITQQPVAQSASNETEAADQASVADRNQPAAIPQMLVDGDPHVCADLNVQATALSLWAQPQNLVRYYQSGGTTPFNAVSATGVNPQISEVSCSATVTIDDARFAITYNVRPALDAGAEFVVDMGSADLDMRWNLNVAIVRSLQGTARPAKSASAPTQTDNTTDAEMQAEYEDEREYYASREYAAAAAADAAAAAAEGSR